MWSMEKGYVEKFLSKADELVTEKQLHDWKFLSKKAKYVWTSVTWSGSVIIFGNILARSPDM